MMDKFINILKDGTISIPKILLLKYKELKLKEKDLVVLIYIINEKKETFNPEKIGRDLNLKIPEVLEIIENLNNADLISIVTRKSNNVIEEIIDMSSLYKKLAYLVINEEKKEKEKSNIYDNFEKEFGRTLSPIEYELISGWLDNYNEEIIKCALKEAVWNGVSNLRYIDKILYEWKKKGINSKDDVEKDRKQFKKNNTKKTEMFDYDWLNDDTENN
ncbi:MAG: DnaD domain protein [Bacilli bacterium]|nr:DnaD domain protein [Bacilli bacterium]